MACVARNAAISIPTVCKTQLACDLPGKWHRGHASGFNSQQPSDGLVDTFDSYVEGIDKANPSKLYTL
jgi:hypothetical protein